MLPRKAQRAIQGDQDVRICSSLGKGRGEEGMKKEEGKGRVSMLAYIVGSHSRNGCECGRVGSGR